MKEGFIYSITDRETGKLCLPVTIGDAVQVGNTNLTQALKEINDSNSKLYHLYLGSLENAMPDASGHTSTSQTYVTTQEYIVPEIGLTIKFKLPDTYKAIVTHGINARTLIISNEYSNGSTFTFRNSGNVASSANTTDNVYRISFRKYSSGSYQNITTTEIQNLINAGNIDITYSLNYTNDIFSRNDNAYLEAARTDASDHQPEYYNQNICILHASDGHSDYTRVNNIFNFAKTTNPNYVVLSGDFVNYGRFTNDWSYLKDLDSGNTIPVIPCIGNHEMSYSSKENAYNSYLKYFVEKNHFIHSGVTTYFYYDDTKYKIRFISMNQNEYDTPNEDWKYNISQEQIDWFISTLQSTPANYGVILICHMPEIVPTYSGATYDYSAWFGANTNYNSNNMWAKTGTPLTKIIDAFIRKTSVSGTYGKHPSGTISYSANFSSLNTGVDFICWMTGHVHCDCIGYVSAPNSSTKQLMLNITTANAGMSTNGDYSGDDNLPRKTYGKTQDAFNMYVINKTTKKVKIIRIGSDMSRDMVERKFIEVSYEH